MGRGRAAQAQAANCAVRRDAFEAVGGGDDLSLRLRALGWSLERRAEARVERRAQDPRTAAARSKPSRPRHVARAALVALLAGSALLAVVLTRRMTYRAR